MGMRIHLSDVNAGADGVWTVRMTRTEIERLGTPVCSGPGRSVLLATSGAVFDENSRKLEIPVEKLILSYCGNDVDADVVIVAATSCCESSQGVNGQVTIGPVGGDEAFLSHVSRDIPTLSETARSLVRLVRQFSDGQLVQEHRRYVERPINFWTTEVQRTISQIKITLYGRPHDFSIPSDVQIKDDRPGYSAFKLSSPNQLESAAELVKQAWRRSQWKRR